MNAPEDFTYLTTLIRENLNTPSFRALMSNNFNTILAALDLAGVGLAATDTRPSRIGGAAAGAASATGTRGAAMSSGYSGRAMGATGNALFLVYRDPDNGDIKHAWAGIVGKKGIKPDVWYTLSEKGKPVEVS